MVEVRVKRMQVGLFIRARKGSNETPGGEKSGHGNVKGHEIFSSSGLKCMPPTDAYQVKLDKALELDT